MAQLRRLKSTCAHTWTPSSRRHRGWPPAGNEVPIGWRRNRSWVTPTRSPGDWSDAAWRHAAQFLERIDGHERIRKLFSERKSLTEKLAKTYREVVEKKTWLGLHEQSTSGTLQALQAYLAAVQAMGAGTGKRAERHRKDAREAMSRAYAAVPRRVMPQYRVSESIPGYGG